MGTRQGTLLEKNVAKIFELSGFKVKHQHRIKGYEVDVYAIKDKLTIACECKQYEKSNINVRNLIHLWDSKNKEINASKVVIALYGIKVSRLDYTLAQKYGIILWEERNIANYLDLLIDNKNKGAKVLLNDLKINPINKGKFEDEDSFDGIIEDKEIPLTNHIKVTFEDELIENNIEVVIEPTYYGGMDDMIKVTELPLCFVEPKNSKKMDYFISSHWGRVGDITAIWLNSKKEIIQIIRNQNLDSWCFGKYHRFDCTYPAKYCLLLIYDRTHNKLQIRDKLTFIEIR